MIAIIKGDIVDSRKQTSPGQWIDPLKAVLNRWGQTPKSWELVWGDFFQLEVSDPLNALNAAFQIKACIKSLSINSGGLTSPMDVRIAVGIGEKTFDADRISESNGSAFHHAGDAFEMLQKERRMFIIGSPWEDFNQEMNLYLKLLEVFANKWSVSSAELVEIALLNPGITQTEIGKKLGIQQNSVSGRWNRANIDEMLNVDKIFRQKLKNSLL